MKRTIIFTACLLLAALLLIGGCGKPTGEGTGTNAVPTAAGSGSEIVITSPEETSYVPEAYANYERDDLPENLNYEGSRFGLLCDEGQYAKSFADEYTGDVINSALFTRREAVQERLKVEIDVVKKPGAYKNMAAFTADMKAGGDEYDLVLSYNLTPASMAVQGLLCNLSATEYLNFSKPWWSSTLTENVSLNGKIFFTADNSGWNNIRNMLGIFVNKNILSTYKKGTRIEDLYKLVNEGGWTMEKMFELADGVYNDEDNDLAATAKDLYGLCTANQVWNEAWFYAAGFTTMKKTAEGELSLSMTDVSIVDFLDWFRARFYSGDPTKGVMSGYDSSQYAMFKDARAMMYLSAISIVEQKLDYPFSVLPLPKYNESQSRYYTHFSNTYDMYCIPVAASDKTKSSAVLECLASEAYRRVGPAYFEVYLKYQNADDAGLAGMYDKIRESIVFDTGYLYGELFVSGDNPIYFVRRCLNNVAGYENFAAKWTTKTESQYNKLWEKNSTILKQLAD